MSQESETTSAAPASAVPATSTQASGRVRAAPIQREPIEDLRTSPDRADPVYLERDTMREFERLSPFKGERSEWRNWSLKARYAASAAGLERVMTGKSPRPRENEDINVIDEWNHKNQRVYTRLVMLLEGAVSGIARNNTFGDGAAIWKELERRFSVVSEEQGERLRGELDTIRMNQGEDFDIYATRVESLAEQVRESNVHYSRNAQQRALIRGIPDRFENVREMLLFGNLGDYETVEDQLRVLILNDRERRRKHSPAAVVVAVDPATLGPPRKCWRY